jgi:hypothetical protein
MPFFVFFCCCVSPVTVSWRIGRRERRGEPPDEDSRQRGFCTTEGGEGEVTSAAAAASGRCTPAARRPPRSELDAPARPCSAGRCVRNGSRRCCDQVTTCRARRDPWQWSACTSCASSVLCSDAAFTAAPRRRQVFKSSPPVSSVKSDSSLTIILCQLMAFLVACVVND